MLHSVYPQSSSKSTGHSCEAQELHQEAPHVISAIHPLLTLYFSLPPMQLLHSFNSFAPNPCLRSGFQNQSPIDSKDQGSMITAKHVQKVWKSTQCPVLLAVNTLGSMRVGV